MVALTQLVASHLSSFCTTLTVPGCQNLCATRHQNQRDLPWVGPRRFPIRQSSFHAFRYVDTPILGNALSSGYMQPEMDKTPMRRAAKVEEISDAILFLVSPQSSFVCGASLVVDGGRSI